jgi:ribosomal protein S27E
MVYRVIQCPGCGNANVTSSSVTLKCKYCNKSTALVSAKGEARVNVLGVAGSAQEAARLLREINRKWR